MTDITARLREACTGQPAEIEWPHRLLHDAADEIERLHATIRTVADNLGCGPANIVEWSAKAKAGLLELDRLQQETALRAE